MVNSFIRQFASLGDIGCTFSMSPYALNANDERAGLCVPCG